MEDVSPALVRVENGPALLNKNDEAPNDLLRREAYMLGGGIKDGFLDRLHEAKEHPGLTALEIVGSAAVGAGLTAMNVAGGRWAAAAKIAGRGFGLAAIADGVRRLEPTVAALADTNPDRYVSNRATVAKYLGTACFDYPLMAAGATAGAAAASYGPTLVRSFRAKDPAATAAEVVPIAKLDDSAAGKLNELAETNLRLRADADRKMQIARDEFYKIAGSSIESDNVRPVADGAKPPGARINTDQLLQYVKSSQFRDWVKAEKTAGNEVFWPTDVDKTLASGDIFTHFFEWRAKNNKFTPEQRKIVGDAVKELVPTASSTTPQDVIKLWHAKEAGKEGISLNDFWSKIYWPSQKGLTPAQKMAQINEFAPTYSDKVYPGVVEVNRAIEDAGAHVVIVSNGDQELARGVAKILGIKPENSVGSNLLYGADGLATGANHTYEIFEGPWTSRPQPGKPMSFHYWLHENMSRFGWKQMSDDRIVFAGFNGDSASADGGMMILSKRKGIGNFMVNTPGEPARIENFYKMADKYGWTKGEFVTLERKPSPFDLKNGVK